MKKRQQDKLTEFYQSYEQEMKSLEKSHTFPKNFYANLSEGKNTVYQKSLSETKTFDETWIKTIESYFPSIEKIILNPKSNLKYNEEVVAIEKAKKIRASSIRHLASHTQFIKEIRDDVVMPKKIMTEEVEINYGTYENRFIMTLIDRLFTFVRTRHDLIKDNIISFQKKHFNYVSEFNFDDMDVQMNIDLTFKEDLEDKSINQYNQGILSRVAYLSKRVSSIKSSAFMELLKGEKKVIPPIMQTNVMLKNVDFKNCYMLWLFLDRYNTLAYDVTVREQDLRISDIYQESIEKLALNTFSAIAFNQGIHKDAYDKVVTKETVKKAFKHSSINIKDQVDTPEPIVVEDERINQYYLQENLKVFKKHVEEEIERSSTYEVGLKRALRDTIGISNAIFQHHFELESNEDIFSRLVKDDDVEKHLADQKDKAKIARIIRETKEVDYNNAIRLEKKLMKEIETANQRLLQMLDKKALDEASSLEVEAKLKEEKELAIKEQQLLADNLAIVGKNREALAVERKRVDDVIKAEQEKHELNNQSMLDALREHLNKGIDAKIATLDRHFEQQKQVLEKEHAKDIKQLEREEKQAITMAERKAKANYRQAVQQLKKKLKAEQEKSLKKLKLQREKEQERLRKDFERLKLQLAKRKEKELQDIEKNSKKDILELKKNGLEEKPKETKPSLFDK
ncbi:MAG: hypothetical protein RBQ91_01320 [Acholeplasma sp.]|nr:hypothetical protein [Acholeplasma sp.]